jgi:hypothetical protein
LIRDLHNSNKELVQITLLGEKLPIEKFFLLGFVPADIVDLSAGIWFSLLNAEQIAKVDEFLGDSYCY